MAKWSYKKIYDSKKGRPIREIKANNIVHISSVYNQASAGSTIAFTTLSSTSELYITGFGVSAGAAQEFCVTVNTSTILPVRLSSAGEVHITTNREAPFYVAPAGATVSIVALTAGSCCGWLCGVVEPTFEKVETA
ncbi:MAG: hypothetical protein J7J91_08965 [Deltaproteobacteria bacterium]|nr:hypothetical protein [Deltaproteobacteria bacterium]RLF79077.1 MAG: hypothetical protein DRN32_05695 [Thermococci archaeon]